MTKDLANTQTTAQNLLKVFVASPYQLQNLSERMRPIQEMGLGGSYLYGDLPAGGEGRISLTAMNFPQRRRGRG